MALNQAITKTLSNHLLQRGFEAVNSYVSSSSKQFNYFTENEAEPMPIWVVMLLCVTVYLLVAFSTSVSYTIGHVVNTLTIIETPTEAITVKNTQSDSEEDSNAKDPLVPAVTVIKPELITAQIQTAIQHLKATAGFWSQWRGCRLAIKYWVVARVIRTIVDMVLGRSPANTPCGPYGFFSFVSVVLAAILTSTIVAPLHMAWTHATIAMGSKGLRARLPCRKQWRLLLIPAAVLATTEVLGQQFLLFCQLTLGGPPSMDSNQDVALFGVKTILFMVAAITYSLFITLPAEVALARIEASMLPEEEDAIVPFDRSFNGKVVPAVVSGSGAVGFWDAWRSFNREARWRLIKLKLNLFAFEVAILLLGIHLVGFEIWATTGKDGFRTVVRTLIDMEIWVAIGQDGFRTVISDLFGLNCSGFKVLD